MAGISSYLRNKIHDWLHREQAFDPPGTVYLALCTSAPTATVAGTEVTGTGYARATITHSLTDFSGTQGPGTTVASSGTNAYITNNSIINFGTAGSDWGSPTPVSHWETYDASSGGNRLEYGAIVNSAGTPTPRSIATGDPVSFPAGAFKYSMV